MALPEFSMRSLLEAGAHFGHQTHRWNPKMDPFIFGSRSNIHIIDLSQSIPLLHQALVKVREVAAGGGRVLFVGTKRQASEPIATAAKRCAQYYVNHRWLGGTLTNWRTISGSIARLRELEGIVEAGGEGRSKKEVLQVMREQEKLELSLGGIKDMGGIPDLMFVIDTNKEAIAILEARKLNIPVIAILDTNCDPDGIAYPIPGNDDAARAIQLYVDLIADSVLDGLAAGQAAMGVDLGAAEAPIEPALKARAAAPAQEAVAEEAPAEQAAPAEEPAAEAPVAEQAAPAQEPAAEEAVAVEEQPEAKAEEKPEAKAEEKPAAEAKEKAAEKPTVKKPAAKNTEAKAEPAKKAPAKPAAKKAETKPAAAKKPAAQKPAAKKEPAKS
jgi:small subunit ribosomal protein S2